MPHGPFAHVSLLVHDLDAAVEHWRRILEVLDPGQVEQRVVRYEDFEGGADRMRWATFVSPHGAEIQLMEPAPDTPMWHRLQKKGEHVHHICLTTGDVRASLARLREKGIDSVGEIASDPKLPWQEWGWVSPKHAHGVLVEVARPYVSHNDGKWHPVEE